MLYSRPISRLLVHEGHMQVSERVAGIRIALYSENMFGHSLDKRSDNLLRYAVHLMLQLGSEFNRVVSQIQPELFSSSIIT